MATGATLGNRFSYPKVRLLKRTQVVYDHPQSIAGKVVVRFDLAYDPEADAEFTTEVVNNMVKTWHIV